MGQPYVGEIRMFAGNYAPAGWEFCSGQLLPISEYEALFQLIGTTYGGDGENNFALPDMMSRIPLGAGTSSEGITYTLGEKSGVESVTLSVNQIPSHNHAGSGQANNSIPCSASPGFSDTPGLSGVGADPSGSKMFSSAEPDSSMKFDSNTGGGQPHNNMPPYLCVNYIISLYGVFPTAS